MPTKEDLKYFQSMPLDIKVAMTKTRIREWITHFGVNGTYVSFSGGKDSTVLLHLVRELYPDVEAVFVNTGLEYPEIQSFVKTFENVTILRPEMPFNEVIKQYGYPFISKEISRKVYDVRVGRKWAVKYLLGEAKAPDGSPSQFNIEKYSPLLKTDFFISNKCCDVMKKGPVHKYEKLVDKTAMTATMASESRMREAQWLKSGCNAFDNKKPISNPMSFWTENDVLQYCDENGIKIASVYGDIVKVNNQYQYSMFDDEQECKYRTTCCDRTGCIFCGYGAHLNNDDRFLRLKKTHPKQYRYCIEGGEHDINGIWKPNSKGLGMGHVIDKLNKLYSKNGKAFIEY